VQLAIWATALAVGIVVGIATRPAIAVGSLVLLLLGALAFAWRRSWKAAFALVVLASGIGLGARDVAQATRPPGLLENTVLQVEGEIVRGPDADEEALARGTPARTGPLPAPPKRCHLRLALTRVAGRDTTGDVLVTFVHGSPNVSPGDRVRLTARLYQPRGFVNPGLPDERLLARARGIDWLATVGSADEVHRLPGRGSWLGWMRRAAWCVRRAMAGAIGERVREPMAGFIRTMVLGERTDVPASVEDGFRAAGATHVLSVSGLHLAVVVALFYQCVRRLIARLPGWALRLSPNAAASVLSLPACAFYALLTGEAVATVRSAIMASVVLSAQIVNRPFTLAAGIGTAAMVMLVASPLTLLDVSFQLSFASVIALGLFARWLTAVAQGTIPKGTVRKAWGWLTASLSASFAASLCTAPLVAHHFGEITPAAPVGNLMLVPVVELVVLPLGLMGALLGAVHPWLGAAPLWVSGLASRAALALADGFRLLAPVLLVRAPNWVEVTLFGLGAGCLLQGLARGTLARRRRLVLAVLAVVGGGGSLALREGVRRWRSDVEVTFVDVGQGDAALVEGPGGFAALIDGGGRYDNSFDTGARILEPLLRARGITFLDVVILSHPHPDHMNGLFRVLDRFDVGVLWTHGDGGGNPLYAALIGLAEQKGISTPVPTLLSRRGLVLEALSPRTEDRIGVPPGLGTNDASLVIRLGFAGRRVLFVGDIGSEGEAELFQLGAPREVLGSDVLKVPHHGSRYASSEAFLAAVAPSLAVASAGRFNTFGLPNPAALARYARRGIPVIRTDQVGAVSLVVDSRGVISIGYARRDIP
jgi:competence protein ComEC